MNELVKINKEITSDKAFKLDQEIKQIKSDNNNGLWELTAKLKHAREWNIWKILGYESWGAYLADPELSCNEHTVNHYLTMFNCIIVDLELPVQAVNDIDITKAMLIAPHINKQNKNHLLEMARTLSWGDLRIEMKLLQPKIEITPPPEGKYNVIYADPPWDIGSFVLEKWESPIEDKYDTLDNEQLMGIKDLPQGGRLKVNELSADDCALFMWTTLSTLPQALRLMEHWGFKYHITITWDKGGGWSSCGFHRRTELLIVGYKGKLSNVIKQEGDYIPTVFAEPKGEHSKKPEVMYKYIENRTSGTKIELFARNKRPGWNVWGNEV